MNYYEKKIDGKRAYTGRILNLDVDKVLLPDKKCSYREIVRHSGGAAVLYVKDDNVLLVKQFRYAYGKELYEIPAGKLNVGEDTAVAAARELEEEAGLKAKLQPFLTVYPSPGYTDEIIHVFLANNATYIAQKLDESEFLDVVYMPILSVLEMIEKGEICDGKTVAAIYKYLYLHKV